MLQSRSSRSASALFLIPFLHAYLLLSRTKWSLLWIDQRPAHPVICRRINRSLDRIINTRYMKINPYLLTRILLIALFLGLVSSAFAQLNLGYSHGMFPVDVAVDKDENTYLLTFRNSVHIFNKDREFVSMFTVTNDQRYPVVRSIQVDAEKRLHIVDDENDVIDVYETNGTLVRRIHLASGEYQSVALDAEGRYYLADRTSDVVRILDSNGDLVKEFGSGIFGSLYSLHVDSKGLIFTCDLGLYQQMNPAVRVFDSEGNFISTVGVSSPSGAYGAYVEPTAVQTDNTGQIYVYSYGKVIKYYSTYGYRQEYRLTENAQGVQSAGYAFRIVNNKLYFADTHHRVQVFDTSLAYLYTIAGHSAENGRFNVPEGTATDKEGNIWVADTRNHRIQAFDSTGAFTTAFGTYGGSDHEFYHPVDVAVDDDADVVYVLDQGFIKKFSKTGVFIERFGPQIHGASRLVLDNNGVIYVNDPVTQAIHAFSRTGTQLRTISLLRSPEGFAIGPDNLIYVVIYQQVDHRQVFTYTTEGVKVAQFDLPRERRSHNYGVVVTDDHIFIADQHGLRKFLKDGTLIASFDAVKGEIPGSLNMQLPNGGLYRTALTLWNDHLLISDALRVQSIPIRQRITFEAMAPRRFEDEPFQVTATSSAGLPVSLTTSDPSIASINNGVVTIHKPGIVTITAAQEGSGLIDPATPVSRDLIIEKGEQSLTFSPIGIRILGEAPFTLEAHVDTGNPIQFSSDDPSVIAIDGSTATLLKTGTVTLTARAEGDDLYAPAETSQVVEVTLITGVERNPNIITAYPNPTKNRINIDLSDEVITTSLRVVDSMGQPVSVYPTESTSATGRMELNLEHLDAGIYYLCLSTRSRGPRVHKIIKL